MPPRGRTGDGGSRDRGATRTGGALAPSARRKDLRPPVQADPAQEAGALQAACAALGVDCSEAQQRQLLAYCGLLRKWNAVYNLTAVRDPQAMLVQHLFDCLAILPPLRAYLRDGAVVLDVGSGGGLPGVVLAICCPGIEVHCVDTVGKKAAFITQVRAELGLAGLHAHHARVEGLRAPGDLPPATLIVSRAFSSLVDFVELTRHLRAPDGVWAAMKGQWPADELQALPAGLRLRLSHELRVPQLDAQRHLLLIEPA